MARLKATGPRSLGQNFLADPNTLDVIVRLALVRSDEVVLEIGGGEGALSTRLAPLAAHLHVVEVDERLREPLTEALAPFDRVSVHFGDATRLPLDQLAPAPDAVVANLPYSVAASVVLRTIELLPSVSRWLVMVQREVGERLAAPPGGREYGISSVLAQLAADVKVVRAVPRTVFRPVPNVDSALVALTRTGPAAPASLRALVRHAFAHRRKALPRSLALSSQYGADIVPRAREALEALGLPPDARAERLSPTQFAELHERLGG
jgi:16S rRNA (adenine1518-N6/adenine1519-N6)-dimethyltransferase